MSLGRLQWLCAQIADPHLLAACRLIFGQIFARLGMVYRFAVFYAKVEVVTQPVVVVSALLNGEVSLSQMGVEIKHYLSGNDEHGTPIVVCGEYLDDIQKRKTNRNKEAIAHFGFPMVLRRKPLNVLLWCLRLGIFWLGRDRKSKSVDLVARFTLDVIWEHHRP